VKKSSRPKQKPHDAQAASHKTYKQFRVVVLYRCTGGEDDGGGKYDYRRADDFHC
jgi:hypothetical protein